MNLYELETEYKELLEMAEDFEMDEQALADTLEGLEGEIEAKVEGYVKVIRNLESDAKALKEEAKRFSDRATVAENNAKRMKESILNAMNLLGKKEIGAGLFKVKIAGNGGLKPLVIDGNVPEEFIKMIPQNDTEAIRKYLEDNSCDWAHLGERGTHLSIK